MLIFRTSAGASLQLVPNDYGACSSYKEPKALLDSRHELQARASRGDYGACSSYKEPKALLNSRHELQTRASRG